MTETLSCPGCHAQLMLPNLPADQSVQCPRCQHVFKPARQRTDSRPGPTLIRTVNEAKTEPDDDLPLHDYRLTRREHLRGVWTAYLAMTLLAIVSLSFGVQAYLEFERSALEKAQAELGVQRFLGLPRRPAGRRAMQPVPEIEMRWRRWHTANNLVTGLRQIVLWPTALVFLIWICQASGNLHTLQARGLSHSPASAVFLWFVPILNLYRPCVIMQEIWRASHPGAVATPLSWLDTPGSRLIGWWWLIFAGSIVVPSFAIVAYGVWTGAGDEVFRVRAFLLADLGLMAAGVLLIVILRKISDRQRERYKRLYEEAA